MSNKTIKELFLFPHYKIIVFNAHSSSTYFALKGGHVCYGSGKNADGVDTDFANKRMDLYNNKMLGKLSELTDEKALVIFKESRYSKSDYPNFQDMEGLKLNSPLESLKSYLKSEGWDISDDKTWIIIPKPSKKLVGTKIYVEFDICNEEFTRPMIKTTLPVYFTPIKVDTKEIKFSVEVPDYLYDYLMLHPEIAKRPQSKVFQSNIFAVVLEHIEQLSSDALNLAYTDKEEKKAKKVILVSFGSAQSPQRDSYQFGYTGNRTSITYQYFIGYKFKEGLMNREYVCVNKRYESGKGFTDIPTTQRRVYIGDGGTNGFKTIEWTQEREDFLEMIEINFKKLSDNLNDYLKDLNGDKLDLLISNNIKLLN